MASLIIQGLNINYNFKRLATSKSLCNISEKTVTSSVRRAIRNILPNSLVHVSCGAQLFNNGGICTWNGQCYVNGYSYSYTVQ